MNESIIALLGVIGTAAASLWALRITAAKDRAMAELKKYQDLEVEFMLPEGDLLPEPVAARLRSLGSTLRTRMTEDVLTRQGPVLKPEAPHGGSHSLLRSSE